MPSDMSKPVPWRQAMAEALSGSNGFYRRLEGPAGHFRTSVSAASRRFASAVLVLLEEIDGLLHRPARLDLVDMGAGGGQLLTAVGLLAPEQLLQRLRLTGVDLAPRPAGLPAAINWVQSPPTSVRGLIVANEWLDTVPLDITVADGRQLRLVCVDNRGEESPGPVVDALDARWLDRWWPVDPRKEGARAEIGSSRDDAWIRVVESLTAGVALGIDYCSSPEQRRAGLLPGGTLAAYRAGRVVRPVPDGTCDITAAVSLDACAEAGRQALGPRTAAPVLTTQQRALHALGVRRPPRSAGPDAAATLARLAAAGEAAELMDPDGLGGFGWLLQPVQCTLPVRLEDALR